MLQAAQDGRGQSVMINMPYALQNSTDSKTLPGINIPKLTSFSINSIKYSSDDGFMLIHHMADMMTSMTKFHQDNHHAVGPPKPYLNHQRSITYGGRIGSTINHPIKENTANCCIEGVAVGFKTPEKNRFFSHLDSQNLWRDKSYAFTIVMSQVNKVPANQQLPFGGDRIYFPF
eukprot:8038793-Ditylum_brightwellii.AAC.1